MPDLIKIKMPYEANKILGEFFETSRRVMAKKINELVDYRYIAHAKIPPSLLDAWDSLYPNKTPVAPVEVQEAVKDIKGDLMTLIFPDDDYAKLQSCETDDEEEVDVVTDVLKSYCYKGKFRKAGSRAISRAIIDGFVIGSVEWGHYADGKMEGPVIRLHPVRRWYPDLSQETIDDRQWEFIQEISTLNEVKESADLNGYDKEAIDRIAEKMDDENYRSDLPSDLESELDHWEKDLLSVSNNGGSEELNTKNPRVEKLHFWHRTQLNGKRKIGVVTFMNRDGDNPLRSVIDPTGFNKLPVIIGQLFENEDDGRKFPESIPEIAYPQWMVAFEFQSFGVDEAKWGLVGGKIVFKQNANKRGLIEARAGDIIDEDITRDQVFDVNYHSDMFFGIANIAGNNIHRGVGSNDYSSGVNPRNPETARGATYLMQSAAKRKKEYVLSIWEFFSEAYSRMMNLIGRFATINDIYSILGVKWRGFPAQKLAKSLSQSWDFVPARPLEIQLPQDSIEKAQYLLARADGDPDVDRYELKKIAYSAFNITNLDAILPPPENKMVVTDQEHMAMLQGVPVPVHQYEDSQFHVGQHFRLFQELMQSPWVLKSQSAKRVILILKMHIKETIEKLRADRGGQIPMGAQQIEGALGMKPQLNQPRISGPIPGDGRGLKPELQNNRRLPALGGFERRLSRTLNV